MEIAVAVGDRVLRGDVSIAGRLLTRDSKPAAGPVLAITPGGWEKFTRKVKDSQFDL